MASAPNALRRAARTASRCYPRPSIQRGWKSSIRQYAAQNYPMPALSPTMTEGNIANWQVKEGDAYSAGDVLLEIETDKATMDVEAQDDGILMKITAPDGSKGIQVGQRIAVTAESGDDISKLELPADDTAADAGKGKEAAKEETSAAKDETPSKAENKSDSKEDAKDNSPPPKKASEGKQGGAPQKQKYPLYPSVESILHQNGLSEADAENIPASGPNGRLLKGDVLAYLGKITKEYPAESSARLQQLSHLDLSNIKLAPKPEPEPKKAPPAGAARDAELPAETEVAIPISLTSVITTQKRVKDTLGIHLPLSVFIARASELANDDLPVSKSRKPTADDLFNSVLGLDRVAKSSKGHFVPQIVGLDPVPSLSGARSTRKPDIIDILAPKAAKKQTSRQGIDAAVGPSTGENLFSVTAKSGEEKRAAEYLERMKYALETEPGRLVL